MDSLLNVHLVGLFRDHELAEEYLDENVAARPISPLTNPYAKRSHQPTQSQTQRKTSCA